MNHWKIWKLYDKDNNLLIEGRRRDVLRVASDRYVYQLIFTDRLYQTNQPLDSRG